MEKESNIRIWLHMEAMNFALESLWWAHGRDFRTAHHRHNWNDNFWRFCLKDWKKAVSTTALHYSGKYSGHSESHVGHDTRLDPVGITARFPPSGMKVHLSWREVKLFIDRAVVPNMEDRQITMLELLAEYAKEAI